MNRFSLKPAIATAFILFFCLNLYGQKKISRKDSVRQEKIKQGKMIFSQVVAPASAPETGFLLGSASALTFSTRPGDTLVKRSTIPLLAYLSVKGSYGAQSSAVLYFGSKIRWLNAIEFNHLVDNYWGVGYEVAVPLNRGRPRLNTRKTILTGILKF